MSMPNTRVKCTGCDFTGVILSRPIKLIYQFLDGTLFSSYRVAGWCEQCNGIRDIEQEFDATSLQTEIGQISNQKPLLKNFISAVARFLGARESFESVELRRLKLELKLALTRKSSPRCLDCGHEGAISIWREKPEPFKHSCGGQFLRTEDHPDAPVFFYRSETMFLDAEGNRVYSV